MSVATERLYSHNTLNTGSFQQNPDTSRRYTGRGEKSSFEDGKKVRFAEKGHIKKVEVGALSHGKNNGSKRKSSFPVYNNNTSGMRGTDADSESGSSLSSKNASPEPGRTSTKSPVRGSVFHASTTNSHDSSVLLQNKSTKKEHGVVSSKKQERNEAFSFRASQTESDKAKTVPEKISHQYSAKNLDEPREVRRVPVFAPPHHRKEAGNEYPNRGSPKWRKANTPEAQNTQGSYR